MINKHEKIMVLLLTGIYTIGLLLGALFGYIAIIVSLVIYALVGLIYYLIEDGILQKQTEVEANDE